MGIIVQVLHHSQERLLHAAAAEIRNLDTAVFRESQALAALAALV